MNYLGIDASVLSHVATHLNKLLASYNVYYQNLRSFHWHVQGRSFFDLHELFENYYNSAKTTIDEIAERILTIGHKPDGSMSIYLSNSDVKESKDLLDDMEMAKEVLKDQKKLISLMRTVIKQAAEIQDEGTVDLVSGMLSNLEKEAWLLYSWYKGRRIEFLKVNNQ